MSKVFSVDGKSTADYAEFLWMYSDFAKWRVGSFIIACNGFEDAKQIIAKAGLNVDCAKLYRIG